MVDEPEIESMVRQTVVEWLRTLDVHLVAYEMVNAATASDVHKDALQWGLEELASQLDKHGDALAAYIEGRLKEKSGVLRLATNFFDTRGDIVGDVIDSVRKVMKDETHPARQQIEAFVLDYARLLRQEGSAQQRQVLALRDRLVNSPEVVGFVSQTVRNVIDSIMLDLLRSNSRIVASLEQAARDLARRLLLAEQEQVRHLINRKAVDMAVHFSREYAETAVQYISDKVGAWDASTMTEIIEEKVGEDLHAIRINGVIVGGIIGLFIGAAGQLIG